MGKIEINIKGLGMSIQKRWFISNFLLFIFLLFGSVNIYSQKNANEHPNIILIITDQQTASALSYANNPDISTPNLDKLAKTGVMFEKAYVTHPLCVPSRSSMFSGKMPHAVGANSNIVRKIEYPEDFKKNSLANVLSRAGYNCGYGGKWHVTNYNIEYGFGFDKVAGFGDDVLAEKSINFIEENKNSEKPFFLVASFDNPHNICEWARDQSLPWGNVSSPNIEDTPNLPKNFPVSPFSPEALQFEKNVSPQFYPTQNYTEKKWREYRYTYYRLVEKVDYEIGKILNKVNELGLSDDTLIIFTSDHGDGNAAHHWNQKTVLYEEAINVPLLVSYPNKIKSPHKNSTTLVSTGLDIYKTICDFAQVKPPVGLTGESLTPVLVYNKEIDRKQVVVETKFDMSQGTYGRALIGERYKYVLYSWGKNREQLFDLNNDKGEQVNLAVEAKHAKVLNNYREELKKWCVKNDDEDFIRYLIPAK